MEFSTRKRSAKFGNKVVKMKTCHSPVHCWLDSLDPQEEEHSGETQHIILTRLICCFVS
jgi:hypothetical protein